MRSWKSIKMGICRRLYWLRGSGYKKFGKRSLIYKPLVVNGKKYIEIGDRVSILEGARIEAIDKWGIDQQFSPSIKIGEGTSFEQEAHIISAGNLTIGKGCVFSLRAYVNTCNHDYSIPGNVLKNPLIVKDISIGDYCFIGIDAKIFPGVHIGDHVVIGAGSIVMHDLPSYTVCAGTPARVIRKYNFETKSWDKVDSKHNQ